MKTCPVCRRSFEDRLKFCPDDGSSLRFQAHAGDPMIGRVLLRRWRVLERIGAGGFGTVYKVNDLQLNAGEEALKVFNPQFMDREFAEQSRIRFQREAGILRRLSKLSSHIVGLSLFEEDPEEGLFYFFMEYVDGVTLADLVQNEGPLDLKRAMRIAIQICDALLVAHEDASQVIHRDLKLWNVMVTRDTAGDDFVKVLDFGIAKIKNEGVGAVPLTVGMVPGTPGYAAPEQMMGEVDPRSDLYALGVILFSITTGREPWGGLSVAKRQSSDLRQLLRQQEEGRSVPLRQFRPDAPQSLELLVSKLLQPNPDQRFQTARDLKSALQHEIRLLDGVPRRPAARHGKPFPWKPVGAGLGLAVAVGVTVMVALPWIRRTAGPELATPAELVRLEADLREAVAARDLLNVPWIALQVIGLDPDNEAGLFRLENGLRDLARAARDSVEAGRLDGAHRLVEACLQIDGSNTECRELGSNIRQVR